MEAFTPQACFTPVLACASLMSRTTPGRADTSPLPVGRGGAAAAKRGLGGLAAAAHDAEGMHVTACTSESIANGSKQQMSTAAPTGRVDQ